MEIIVIIAIFLLLKLALGPSSPPEQRKHCKVHKWTYNHNEQMQCTVCNFIAGSE